MSGVRHILAGLVIPIAFALLAAGCIAIGDRMMSRARPPIHQVESEETAMAYASYVAAAMPGAETYPYLAFTGAMYRTLPRNAIVVVEPYDFASVPTGSLVVIRPDDGVACVRWVMAHSLGGLLTYSDRGPDRHPSYGWSENRSRESYDHRAEGRSYARNFVGIVRHVYTYPN